MQPLPSVAAGLGLLLLTLQSGAALAFSQAPLSLQKNRGVLQLSNPGERTIRINLQVFPVQQQAGRASAGLNPLPMEEAEQLIRLKTTQFRLSAGSSRTLPYTVLNPSRDFFLCGVSPQGLFTVRVCSRWRAQQSVQSADSPAKEL